MFEGFGQLLFSALVIAVGLFAYVFREQLKALFKNREKEDKQEFERRLVCRAQKLGVRWLPAWPSVMDVYIVYEKLTKNQRSSAAALGGALKCEFASLSRKEADSAARFFLRSVYHEVKHGMAQAPQNAADKK